MHSTNPFLIAIDYCVDENVSTVIPCQTQEVFAFCSQHGTTEEDEVEDGIDFNITTMSSRIQSTPNVSATTSAATAKQQPQTFDGWDRFVTKRRKSKSRHAVCPENYVELDPGTSTRTNVKKKSSKKNLNCPRKFKNCDNYYKMLERLSTDDEFQ